MKNTQEIQKIEKYQQKSLKKQWNRMKLGDLKGIAVRIKALTFSMINKYNARDNINFTR